MPMPLPQLSVAAAAGVAGSRYSILASCPRLSGISGLGLGWQCAVHHASQHAAMQAAATMEQLRKFPAKPVTGGKGDAPNRVKDPLFLQVAPWLRLP